MGMVRTRRGPTPRSLASRSPRASSIHLRYAAGEPRRVGSSPSPAELDLDRANAATHLAFSLGETHCPGAGLSRLEQHIALDPLLDRLPDLRLTPGRNDFTHHPNVTLRAMKRLWVDYG